jgi:hypothetical protein
MAGSGAGAADGLPSEYAPHDAHRHAVIAMGVLKHGCHLSGRGAPLGHLLLEQSDATVRGGGWSRASPLEGWAGFQDPIIRPKMSQDCQAQESHTSQPAAREHAELDLDC